MQPLAPMTAFSPSPRLNVSCASARNNTKPESALYIHASPKAEPGSSASQWECAVTATMLYSLPRSPCLCSRTGILTGIKFQPRVGFEYLCSSLTIAFDIGRFRA